MMGYGDDKGIIPRAVSTMFERIGENADTDLSFKVALITDNAFVLILPVHRWSVQ